MKTTEKPLPRRLVWRTLAWNLVLAVLMLSPSMRLRADGWTEWCDWQSSSFDLDGNGVFDFSSFSSVCSYFDTETGSHISYGSGSQISPGAGAWRSAQNGLLPYGQLLNSINPPSLVGLNSLGEAMAVGLAGLATLQINDGTRFGWIRSVPWDGFRRDIEIEFAVGTNEPIEIGAPAFPRWSPRIDGSGYPLPPPSPADLQQGILRQFGYGLLSFNRGVEAITLDPSGTIWGVGTDGPLDSAQGRYTNVLFSVRENGGDFRVATVLNNSATLFDYEVSISPAGYVFVNSIDGPASIFRYHPADGGLITLPRGNLSLRITSKLRRLSDDRLYATTARGFYRMEGDGSGAEWLSLAETGLTNFNRGVVPSPDGWLYILGQSGGIGGWGGIVRCRMDGTDATRWFEFGPADFRQEKSALLLASDGYLYGTVAGESGAMFRISATGELESLGVMPYYSYCEPNRFYGGSSCYSLGPLRGFISGVVEAEDGFLYGLLGERWPEQLPDAVFRIRPDAVQNSWDQWRGEVLSQNALLNRHEFRQPEAFWEQSPSGVLFAATRAGIVSFQPGAHGVRPVRLFGPTGSDGKNPVGPLLRIDEATLVGVAEGGGVVDEGVIYTVREDGGAGSVLHSFTGSEDDVMKPSGFLVRGDDGWIYGTSQQGERYDFSPKLFRVHAASGAFQVLATLPGKFAGNQQPRCGLMRARDGFFYGTTPRGGVANLGTLFRFDPSSGQVAVIHEFGLTEDDRWQPWPELLESTDGFLYGLVSGGSIDQIDADGLFRVSLDGAGYRLLSRLSRETGALRITGGLTEAADGRLYAVRGLAGAPTTNDAVIGQIIRFEKPSAANEPAPTEIVFQNATDAEPLLSPVGRLVERPDGMLLGLGNTWKTVVYQLHPYTGQIRRLASSGLGSLAAEFGQSARFSSPVLLSDGAVVVGFTAGYSGGRIRRVNLGHPTPQALSPASLTNQYGDTVQVYFPPILFSDAVPPFNVTGLPAELHSPSAVHGYLSGFGLRVGTHRMEVSANDGYWPPEWVTNTITLMVTPRPLTVNGQEKTVAVGSTNLSVTGRVTGRWELDDIAVTWTTAATPESPAGDYLIEPVFRDPESRLGNYVVTTNHAYLHIVEPRATASATVQGVRLSFPAIPGVRYEVERSDRLDSENWQRIETVIISSTSPAVRVYELPEDHSSLFLRIRPLL